MAKGLRKIATGLASLLAILTILQYSQIVPPDVGAIFWKALEALYSAYESGQPYSLVGTIAILILATSLALIRRFLTSELAGYYYAPKGTVRLSKDDVGRFDAIVTVTSKGDLLDGILGKTIEALSLGERQTPMWIRRSKEEISSSYLTREKRQLYEINVLGKKSLLREFLRDFLQRLQVYAREGKISAEEAEPPLNAWMNSMVPVKDAGILPRNLKLKEESLFGWIWRTLIAAAASALLMYLVMRLLGRRVDREKAVEIATGHLESIHGIKPTLRGAHEEAGAHVIEFETHFVWVDKRSGKVIRVTKL